MSRCFPFPPPGYEVKLRSEHKDLLKKEKHKREKHKRERTDGGTRKSKEKDRGCRKDEHKKKHRREKHKDRRKRKERDKDKRQISEQGTQKNDDFDNRRPKQIVHNEVVKDSKHKDELASQITVQEGHANNTVSSTVSKVNEKSGQIGQHNHVSQKGKDKTRVLNGARLQNGPSGKHYTGIRGSNGVGLQQESSKDLFSSTAASKQKHRITPGSDAAQRTEHVNRHLDGSSHSAYGKSDSMSTKGVTGKKNGISNTFHSRMNKQLVGAKNGAVQGNGNIKEVKANHHKGVKDGDRGHGVNYKAVKDRDRDCNVKKRKTKDGNQGKVREKRSVGHEQNCKELDGRGTRKSYIHEMDLAHLNADKFISGDVKKRKDFNTNSSLHEHSMPMTKMPRTSHANHLCVNGETWKHSQGTTLCSSKLPVGTNACEAGMLQDSKECYNNGIAGPHSLGQHKFPASSFSYDSSELSLTQSHPDTKYLSQVYSIPAADDCSEYIDQDWLFSGDSVNQEPTMLEAAEPPRVWAQARPIDSADVVAMPYVVPL